MGLDVAGIFSARHQVGRSGGAMEALAVQRTRSAGSGDFNTTVDANGDTLVYPEGDLTAPPSGRMPQGGYFFDCILRQEPIDEDNLNPEDNLEEFLSISQTDIDYLASAAKRRPRPAAA